MCIPENGGHHLVLQFGFLGSRSLGSFQLLLFCLWMEMVNLSLIDSYKLLAKSLRICLKNGSLTCCTEFISYQALASCHQCHFVVHKYIDIYWEMLSGSVPLINLEQVMDLNMLCGGNQPFRMEGLLPRLFWLYLNSAPCSKKGATFKPLHAKVAHTLYRWLLFIFWEHTKYR